MIFRTLLLLCCLTAPAPALAAGEWAGGGPEIGWVRALLTTSDGTIYAGTWGGGIFRSLDGGQSWAEATTNARDAVVLDLEEGRDVLNTLYAATLDRSLLRKEAATDFWGQPGGYPIGFRPAAQAISLFPFRENRIALGTAFGVYASPDRGATWPDTLSFEYGRSVQDLIILPDAPNTIHAISEKELLFTSDTGQSVDFVEAGLAPSTLFTDLEPWSSGMDSMLVADLKGPLWQLRGRDHFVEVGPVETGPRNPKRFCRIAPSDPDRVLLGSSNGLWRSTDRMGSWELVEGDLETLRPDLWALDPSRVSATEPMILGSFSMGVVRTGPGGNLPWTPSNSGLTAAWARTLSVRGSSLLTGTAHGRLYRSTDQAQSFTDVTGSLRTPQISAVYEFASAWLLSGAEGVFRSTDAGTSWQPVALPGAVTRLNRSRASSDGSALFATNAGIVRASADGATLTQVEQGLPADRACFALDIRNGYLAAGFQRPGGGEAPSLFVGHLDSAFVEIPLPVGFRGLVRGITMTGDDLLVGAAPYSGTSLYRVRNWARPALRSFEDLAPLIGDGFFEVYDLVRAANFVAIGTGEQGVFLSDDAGLTWSEWNDGLPSLRVEDLLLGQQGEIYVATLGRGVFMRNFPSGVAVAVSGLRVEPGTGGVRVRLAVHSPVRLRLRRETGSLGEVVIAEGLYTESLELMDQLPALRPYERVRYSVDLDEDGVWHEVISLERSARELVPPLTTRLLPASPNPFNPRTTVRWEQAQQGRVELIVYDARGRRLRTLVDRELPAGPQLVDFDGLDDHGEELASGVYYLLLRAAGREDRGRVTLLR